MNDAGIHACREALRPGARESDISARMIETLRRLGADWYIRGVVCSGEHTSPQYKTVGGTDRIIQPGDLVLVDVAHAYMSYWSDVARTFVCGDRAAPEQRAVYQHCCEMLTAGLEQVKTGNTTADVVAVWEKLKRRDSVAGVGVGHGLGTTLHEIPIVHDLSLQSPTTFVPDMVIALEVYSSQGRHGVRLEQNLVVTDGGYDLLSKFPYDGTLL
jgi:Xaa-Pro dipeptidase